MELLIVIGVIGVLVAIVIVAINPVKQLTQAYDVDRVSHENQTQKAITQYLIDKWELPQKSKLKEGQANEIEICGPDAPSNDPSCAKLSDDLVAAFLGKMPVDPAAPCPSLRTGYAVYLQDGFIQVESLYMGKTPGQITTPCPTVPPITTTTVLTMTPVNPAAGQNVTLTATVTASDGQTPTGSVTFYDGSTPIPGGTVTLDASGNATLPNVPVSAGVSHTFKAAYGGVVGTGPGGLGSYGVSEQPINPFTIPLVATTTNLAVSPPAPIYLGQNITLTATVTATSGTPVGTVTFMDGENELGTVSIEAGEQAILSYVSLAYGNHSISAKFSGDESHAESSSSIQTVTIIGTAGIRGFTFIDTNGDGEKAGSEPPLPGVTMQLSGPEGTKTTTTDADGQFTFDELPAGTYNIVELPPSGYVFSPPPYNINPITLHNAEAYTDIPFGNKPVP